jgi:hypothetical protein
MGTIKTFEQMHKRNQIIIDHVHQLYLIIEEISKAKVHYHVKAAHITAAYIGQRELLRMKMAAFRREESEYIENREYTTVEIQRAFKMPEPDWTHE